MQKTYGFLKSFKILGKTRSPACRAGSAQRQPKEAPSPRCKTALGSHPKTLEFLMFPAGPRRGNDVNPGMPLLNHGKSYGFLKSFRVLGKSKVPSLQSRQRATATQGGSQSVMKNCAGIPPKNLGIPYVSWWCPAFASMRDRPARKKRSQARRFC